MDFRGKCGMRSKSRVPVTPGEENFWKGQISLSERLFGLTPYCQHYNSGTLFWHSLLLHSHFMYKSILKGRLRQVLHAVQVHPLSAGS